jgi:hypothetical protein
LGYTVSGCIPKGAWSAAVVEVENGASVRSCGIDLAPLELCVSNDRRALEIVFGGPSRQLVLSAKEALVEQIARRLWRQPLPDRDRLTFVSPARRSAFEREALSWLRLAHAKPALLQDTGFAKSIELWVVEELLGGCAPCTPVAATASRHAAARRAREYILESLEQPLSLADLCAQLDVSERTLLQGFLEIYGMSPIAYASVTEVALKWGFFTSADSRGSIAMRSDIVHLKRRAENMLATIG